MSDPQTIGRSLPPSSIGKPPGHHPRLRWSTIVIGLALLIALLACVRFGFLLGSQGGIDGPRPQSPNDSPAVSEPNLTPAPTPTTTSRANQETERYAEVVTPGADGTALDRLQRALASAQPRDQRTADALARFASGWSLAELRSLDRADIEALAAYLADQLSADDMGVLFEQFLGLSPGSVRTADQAESTLVGVYDALVGNHRKEVRPSVLTVTDAADVEGRITGRSHVLPAGTGRVYAVFENDRALAGVDQVLAVWRDPNDDRMVFTEFEPVRHGAAYNYVWLEVESGWPAGRYQVELFHPEAQSLLLASEGFSVR